MKKELIFLILLLITACTTSDSGSSDQDNWRTGSEGIVMSYVADNPPSEVVNTQQFNVIVKYANKGASPTTGLIFHITGHDNNILSLDKSISGGTNGKLGGKTRYNPEGSQEAYAEWKTGIKMSGLEETDSFKQSISVTACYDYETYAEPQICVDTNQYDTVSPTRCDYSIKNLGSSQGGPIVVTKVEKKSTSDKIYLEIEFANKGKGTPYVVKKNCLELKYDEVDKIKIANVGRAGLQFDCNPKEIRLTNDKGFTVCTSRSGLPSSLTELPLPISISYSYRETLPKKEITIVNINT